jgi:hypothetical protein
MSTFDEITITAVDIGIVHLAYVTARIEFDLSQPERQFTAITEYSNFELLHCNLVDITNLPHTRITRNVCRLHHSNDLFDRVQHMLQEYPTPFKVCDKLLLERQPPCGHTAVEQLLFGQYREKAILIHPRSMHAFLGIGHLDYEGRKEATEAIATTSEMAHENAFIGAERKHDMADAFCIIKYYISLHIKKLNADLKRIHIEQRVKECKNIFKHLETFRYTPQ